MKRLKAKILIATASLCMALVSFAIYLAHSQKFLEQLEVRKLIRQCANADRAFVYADSLGNSAWKPTRTLNHAEVMDLTQSLKTTGFVPYQTDCGYYLKLAFESHPTTITLYFGTDDCQTYHFENHAQLTGEFEAQGILKDLYSKYKMRLSASSKGKTGIP